MEPIELLIFGVLGTWIASVGSAMVVVLWKLNNTVIAMRAELKDHKRRIGLIENAPAKRPAHAGRVSYLLLIVAVFMAVTFSGCSMFGLDAEQLEADAEETASALEIVKTRLPALEKTKNELLAMYDAAIVRGDMEGAARMWPELQKSVKAVDLTKAEKLQLTATIEKQVSAFTKAKDTKGYLQAGLSLLGGVFMTFLGGRKVVGTRNRLIKAASDSANVVFGAGNSTESEEFRTEIKGRLNKSDQALLDKLRKA